MTNGAKLQAIPKKNIVIILIVVLADVLLFAMLAFALNKTGFISSQMPKQSLAIWKIVGILLSLYTFITPWRWQSKIISRANQYNMTGRQIWGMLILFCYVPLVAPLIYGLVLLFWGLSLMEFNYFLSVSVGGALIWSIYNLRMNK